MDINRVFFWFCKEQGIMDIMLLMYRMRKFGIWRYDSENGSYYERLSLKKYISETIMEYGFKDLFWRLQPSPFIKGANLKLLECEKYKKARGKWNSFVKKNLKFSDDFMKIGDKVETFNRYGQTWIGTVVGIPKEFDGSLTIKNLNDERICNVSIIGHEKILVNDVEKEPEFYIKRKRKIYGINKE